MNLIVKKITNERLSISRPYLSHFIIVAVAQRMISMASRLLLTLAFSSVAVHSAAAFGFAEPPVNDGNVIQRRRFLQSTAALTVASWTGGGQSSPTPWLSPASAEDVATEVPMKMFVDTANPSLFAIEVPKRFFSIRRSAKGDLPDPKTGKGELRILL